MGRNITPQPKIFLTKLLIEVCIAGVNKTKKLPQSLLIKNKIGSIWRGAAKYEWEKEKYI